MLRRREVLRWAAASAAVTLASACAPIAPANSATPALAQTAPAAQTTSGSSIKLGLTAELPNLESHQMSPSTFNVVYQVHDQLIEYDAIRQPVPQLAESWDFSADRHQ